ncbi:hypothetical protein C8R46DRAFT_890643, partial [Mycena filopes]
MAESVAAGRKPPTLYTNHFTRFDKVNNKGNRYLWRCNYCGDDENSKGTSIEGRDNALPAHLADSRKCSKAPPGARAEALRFMADKKKTSETEPATSSPASDVAVIDVDAEPAAVVKKRKGIHGPLASFLDQGMTTVQQNSADRKLLRFIIHTNSAFRSVEDPFLHDFLQDLRPTYTAPGRYAL